MNEGEIIKFEAERYNAMDKYFSARPHLLRTGHNEKIFEAGFRMAWEVLINQQE